MTQKEFWVGTRRGKKQKKGKKKKKVMTILCMLPTQV